jgi:hypothetical protein
MSDLTESRISEIRTDYALAHDLLDTAAWISSIAPETTHVMRVVQAVMYLQGKAASRPSPESVAHLIRVDPWACAIAALVRQHDRSDLESLLAEREGMRKKYQREYGNRMEAEMNLLDARRELAKLLPDSKWPALADNLAVRLSAPLDPSSAPTHDLAELFNMIARRDPSVTAELFDTREFGERAARIYAALGESDEQRVARIFDEARRQMKPKIDAELQGENITSEIMDFRMRSSAPSETPDDDAIREDRIARCRRCDGRGWLESWGDRSRCGCNPVPSEGGGE